MFFSHKEQKSRRAAIFAAKNAKSAREVGVFRIGALPRAPETRCVSVTLCEISHGEEKTSVRGGRNLRAGKSNPACRENEQPYWAANPLHGSQKSAPWVSKIPLLGLKIPLHGSQNSAPRVSKFCSMGLKNPLRLGIRELSTTRAPCSTPLRCLSLASSFACLPCSSP